MGSRPVPRQLGLHRDPVVSKKEREGERDGRREEGRPRNYSTISKNIKAQSISIKPHVKTMNLELCLHLKRIVLSLLEIGCSYRSHMFSE